MGGPQSVLLIGFSAVDPLSERLRALRFRIAYAASLDEALRALQCLEEPVRAALLPPQPTLPELAQALVLLRERSLHEDLRFVIVGRRPGPEAMARLRAAGLELALWEPFSDGELRFLVNYALYNPRRGESRREPRVPTTLQARIHGGTSERSARVYSLSTGGAFLETERPVLVGGEVFVDLPLPSRHTTIQAVVVSNNVAGNLEQPHLPRGMGVCFCEMEAASAAAIARYVEERACRYQLDVASAAPSPGIDVSVRKTSSHSGAVQRRPSDPSPQSPQPMERLGGRAPALGSDGASSKQAEPRAAKGQDMEGPPPILVLDENGELDDVCLLLDELGAELRHRTEARPAGRHTGRLATHLVVSTPGHALALELGGEQSGSAATEKASSGPAGIALIEHDSRTLVGRLRDRGFRYVVRRPVHPKALRLLLLQVLYQGDEKRTTERLPIGSVVSYRTGFRRRLALLSELSARGCRLHGPVEVELDTPITISLPKDLTDGQSLSLSGWVVRCDLGDRLTPDRPFCLGVAFEELSADKQGVLRQLLASRSQGPATLPAEEAIALASTTGGEQRRPSENLWKSYGRMAPRRPYRANVAAVKRRGMAMRTLIGRNVSTGGMLVERNPDLALGDRLSLAIFGAPDERIVVRAVVLRDDGPEGLALHFEDPSPETRERLQALVCRLPTTDDAGQRDADVVSEIIRGN